MRLVFYLSPFTIIISKKLSTGRLEVQRRRKIALRAPKGRPVWGFFHHVDARVGARKGIVKANPDPSHPQ